MSSAAKALTLLSHFSTTQPEIGLSQFGRLVRRDKATTFRHLQALETAGLVERNPITKRYRLGPAVLQLAHVRETTVPRKTAAQQALESLVNSTGETAHVSVLSGTTLYALSDCTSSKHATRAIVDIDTFPLHATASGLCALAFGPENLFEIALTNPERFTTKTTTTRPELVGLVEQARKTGFSHGERSYEDEVEGIAAPLFDQSGGFAGAVAVVSVASRFSCKLENTIKSELITAAREISRKWGGQIPASIEIAWEKFIETQAHLEMS